MFSQAEPDYYSIMIFVFTQKCPGSDTPTRPSFKLTRRKTSLKSS